jgi:hypothetical protein
VGLSEGAPEGAVEGSMSGSKHGSVFRNSESKNPGKSMHLAGDTIKEKKVERVIVVSFIVIMKE